MLIDGKFIALNLSHWRQWLADALSSDPKARDAARQFYAQLGETGYTVLFCWHHLEELMAVEDVVLAARRLAFIRSLPFLAWIGIVPDEDGLGAITDIMAAEVEAALAGEGTLQSVRAAAKRRLLKFGSGEGVVVDHPAFLSLMQWHSKGRVQKDRSITAIAPFEFLQPDMRVRDLMNQGMRSEGEVRLALERQHKALTNELEPGVTSA